MATKRDAAIQAVMEARKSTQILIDAVADSGPLREVKGRCRVSARAKFLMNDLIGFQVELGKLREAVNEMA